MKYFLFCLTVLLLISCDKDEDPQEPAPETPAKLEIDGLSYANSSTTFDSAEMIIVDALTAAGPISIVAQVDHTANASSVGETLTNTKVILFGNPALGTPLMQKNQLAGLDLPQKFLIIEDNDAMVRVAYNDPSYLEARHELTGEASLATIGTALANFANMTTDEELLKNSVSVTAGEGITTKTSTNSFDSTYQKLIAAITANPNLKIIAELDHRMNAASVNLELRPTKLVVFGNPNLGTPLMQSKQSVGIDLPQKMLVWEDADGLVQISYNDPQFIASRHKLSGVDDQIGTISQALDNLSNAAIVE